jgi:hypothetical protein
VQDSQNLSDTPPSARTGPPTASYATYCPAQNICRCIGRMNEAAKCNIQAQHSVGVISAFQSAAARSNVVATFRKVALDGNGIPHPHCAVTRHALRHCKRLHGFHAPHLTTALADLCLQIPRGMALKTGSALYNWAGRETVPIVRAFSPKSPHCSPGHTTGSD